MRQHCTMTFRVIMIEVRKWAILGIQKNSPGNLKEGRMLMWEELLDASERNLGCVTSPPAFLFLVDKNF